MKIAIYHSLTRGGAWNIARQFAVHLAKRNVVQVFSIGSENDLLFGSDRGGTCIEKKYSFSMSFGFPNLVKNFVPLIDFARLSLLARRVAQDIDSGGFDAALLFACRYMQSPLVLRFLQTKSLYYCPEPFRFFCEPKAGPGRNRRFLRQLGLALLSPWHNYLWALEKTLPRRATMVFTHSEFTKRWIREVYGIVPEICRLGVDLSKFYRIPEIEKKNLILSVGALVWKKGHEDAIKAAALIPADVRPKVVIVGNWSEKAEERYLNVLARHMGVQTDIRVGCTNDEQLLRLYNEAMVTVCLAYAEPFGLTPLESMACGTPVVAVGDGGYRETVVDGMTGFIVPRCIEAISARIRTLQDRELNTRMGESGRKHVEDNWQWDRAVKDLERLLETLVGSSER